MQFSEENIPQPLLEYETYSSSFEASVLTTILTLQVIVEDVKVSAQQSMSSHLQAGSFDKSHLGFTIFSTNSPGQGTAYRGQCPLVSIPTFHHNQRWNCVFATFPVIE